MKNSSYQRLKRKIADLENDLRLVCVHPNSQEAAEIVSLIQLKYKVEHAMMFGAVVGTRSKRYTIDGIINHIN